MSDRLTVGALTAAHLGHHVRIPDLIQPGHDYDEPRAETTGRLTGLRLSPGRGLVIVDLTGAHFVNPLQHHALPYHPAFPLDHPVEVAHG